MPDTTPSIEQLVRNYIINLPAFPPAEPALAKLHSRMRWFYERFADVAYTLAIETDQSLVLQRIQKLMWALGRDGSLDTSHNEPNLVLEGDAARKAMKFSKPRQVSGVLAMMEMPLQVRVNGDWETVEKQKEFDAVRLWGEDMPALKRLVGQVTANNAKSKVAYERFLRINPQAVVAGDKPPLDLAPDAPMILANLPEPAAQALQALTGWLAEFDGYQAVVEFRAIHHGMWVANYASRRSGRDLCGLIVQDGEMCVRMILYRVGHLVVKEHLAEFGDVVADAFRRAHYYEKFEHQWLFVPVRSSAELVGVKKLLELMPGLLAQK